MARSKIVITESYQEIATGPAMITIRKVGAGTILFNDVNTDDIAAEFMHSTYKNKQIQRTAVISTCCRSTGLGWEIVVDENI